jgi:hypothetical protein
MIISSWSVEYVELSDSLALRQTCVLRECVDLIDYRSFVIINGGIITLDDSFAQFYTRCKCGHVQHFKVPIVYLSQYFLCLPTPTPSM